MHGKGIAGHACVDLIPSSRSAHVVRLVRGRVRWAALVALIGLLTLSSYGSLNAYAQYRQVRTLAAAGVLHLKSVQALLAPYLRHPTPARCRHRRPGPAGAAPSLTAAMLSQVTGEIEDAERHLTTSVAPLTILTD